MPREGGWCGTWTGNRTQVEAHGEPASSSTSQGLESICRGCHLRLGSSRAELLVRLSAHAQRRVISQSVTVSESGRKGGQNQCHSWVCIRGLYNNRDRER